MKCNTKCGEKKEDNPFGPVCQCCNCLQCSSRSKFGLCAMQSPVPYKWHPKPKFRLFFKKGIPCLECKRVDCPYYFLHSKVPCSKKSTCNLVYPPRNNYNGEWMMSWKLCAREWEREERLKNVRIISAMRPRRKFSNSHFFL